MTSLDSARFSSFATNPRTYDAGITAGPGARYSGLDKIASVLSAVIALGPLAVTAWGGLIGA